MTTETTTKKLIAVIGGTGQQGGALLNAVLANQDHEFSCRVVTRDADSECARKLRDKGFEIAEADLGNIESLKKAFAGAYGVFGVTAYWEHNSVEKEIQQGKNICDAARYAGVEHTVWSTLESCKDIITAHGDSSFKVVSEPWIVPHFDGKAEVSKYFRSSGVPFTDFHTAYFLENLLSPGTLMRVGEKEYKLPMNMEDSSLPVVSVDDIGRAALALFQNKDKFLNKEFFLAGGCLPVQELAEKLSKHLGITVTYDRISYEDFRKKDFPGADDMANMFHFKHKYNEIYCKNRNIEKCRELVPELESVDDWIERHKDELLEVLKKEEVAKEEGGKKKKKKKTGEKKEKKEKPKEHKKEKMGEEKAPMKEKKEPKKEKYEEKKVEGKERV